MNTTPQSERLTVAIFGRCNSGKSALFNAITDTDNAIVSGQPGTTTDPVAKSMELIPHGPIVLIDTAGLGDGTALGEAREKKTRAVLGRTDLALYAIDPLEPDLKAYRAFERELKKHRVPVLPLLMKADAENGAAALKGVLPEALEVSSRIPETVEALKKAMAAKLDELAEEHYLIKGLLEPGAVAVLVVPVDSEAPKGRLILPQVRLIRECLDQGIRCHVTTERELPQALRELARIDLVVTDSQAFGQVAEILPPETPLTSFSILMAREKCDVFLLEQGARALASLEEGDRVLIAETCTHNRSHEDIGRVKIPRLLEKKTGKKLRFDFVTGRDYPENLGEYKVVIHCGGCMITRREMGDRAGRARDRGVPVTNYGMALAWCGGILARSMEPIRKAEQEYDRRRADHAQPNNAETVSPCGHTE